MVPFFHPIPVRVVRVGTAVFVLINMVPYSDSAADAMMLRIIFHTTSIIPLTVGTKYSGFLGLGGPSLGKCTPLVLNRLEESSVIRLLLEIMGAVSSFGRYRPYWDSIVGACYVARTLLYAGLLSVRRPGKCILGRGTDRIYPLGRLPTHHFRVLGFSACGKK